MSEGIRKQVDNEVTIQDSHIQAVKDFLTCSLGLVLIHMGECLRVPTMPPIGQLAYRTGAKHHGVEMFGHALRFSVQRIAWVAQQVQDSGMSSTDLLQLQVLFFVSEEGVNVDGWQWRCRGNPLPPVLLGVVSFLMPVAAKMHGELQHASHEDCG